MVKKKSKKKQMNVFLANQTWVEGGKYNLHWGTEGTNAINRNVKRFNTRKSAVKEKNRMVKKFKKQGYKVDYIYALD